MAFWAFGCQTSTEKAWIDKVRGHDEATAGFNTATEGVEYVVGYFNERRDASQFTNGALCGTLLACLSKDAKVVWEDWCDVAISLVNAASPQLMHLITAFYADLMQQFVAFCERDTNEMMHCLIYIMSMSQTPTDSVERFYHVLRNVAHVDACNLVENLVEYDITRRGMGRGKFYQTYILSVFNGLHPIHTSFSDMVELSELEEIETALVGEKAAFNPAVFDVLVSRWIVRLFLNGDGCTVMESMGSECYNTVFAVIKHCRSYILESLADADDSPRFTQACRYFKVVYAIDAVIVLHLIRPESVGIGKRVCQIDADVRAPACREFIDSNNI
jgi:hypothetical protein